jgi:hypothetical protein
MKVSVKNNQINLKRKKESQPIGCQVVYDTTGVENSNQALR